MSYRVPSMDDTVSMDVEVLSDDDSSDAPLGGEEGVMVTDEACFVDEHDGREGGGIDFLVSLPEEIALYILLHLSLHPLVTCLLVSSSWHRLAADNQVWRDLFHREPRWRIDESVPPPWKSANRDPFDELDEGFQSGSEHGGDTDSDSPVRTRNDGLDMSTLSLSRSRVGGGYSVPSSPLTSTSAGVGARILRHFTSSATPRRAPALIPSAPIPSPTLSRTPTAPLSLDWRKLYQDRWTLDRRWERAEHSSLVLRGHTDSVYCIAFDAKRERLISGGRDGTLRIWDVTGAHGGQVDCLRGHEASVLCLQWDETMIASGSSDCRILLWQGRKDAVGRQRWEVRKTLVGHSMGVLNLKFDERVVVSCSKDTSVRVWDRETGEMLRVLSGHRGPVNAVDLYGGLIVSGSGDSSLKLWDWPSGTKIRSFSGHARGLACLCLTKDGTKLVTGSNDHMIKIWDVETGKCEMSVDGHTDLVRSVKVDLGRGIILSGSYDRTLRAFDLETGTPLIQFNKAHTSLIFDVAVSVDKIASSSHDQKITVLDFGRGLDCGRFY